MNVVSTQTTPTLFKSHSTPDLVNRPVKLVDHAHNFQRQKSVEITRTNQALIRQNADYYKSPDTFLANQNSITDSDEIAKTLAKSEYFDNSKNFVDYDQASDIRNNSSNNSNQSSDTILIENDQPVENDNMIENDKNLEEFSVTETLPVKVLFRKRKSNFSFRRN